MNNSGSGHISIKHKIGLIFLLILLAFSVVIIFQVTRIINSGVEKAVLEKVRGDLALGNEILDLRHPGSWEEKDGKLYKGGTLMSGNFEVVDHIGSMTGGTVTIFHGDTRVATNVKNKDGTRAVNTKVSDIVANAVLAKGERYYGEAVVVDQKCQTAYQPIRNAQGKIIGIWYVGISKEIVGQMVKNAGISVMGVTVTLLALSFLTGNILFRRIIIKPLETIKTMMAHAEKGDLTVRGEIVSRDEMGQLISSFNQFIERIKNMLTDIRSSAVTIRGSLDDMFNMASRMASNNTKMKDKIVEADEAVGQITESIKGTAAISAETSSYINNNANALDGIFNNIQELASASEQIAASVEQISAGAELNSESINSIAQSSRDMSASVGSVAAAVKEINISLNEVSSNCERSIVITDNAGLMASETSDIIERLSNSSKQIGNIVNVINDIAEQTKMLALNAAIEAAGAGEAGRGFAVVANEVKELARQTAEATDEIGLRIEDMQVNMAAAVKAVGTITGVIGEITDITSTIASAVTEQSSSTGEISRSVVLSAEKVNAITQGITEVAENAAQSARIIDETSRGLQDIAKSVNELSFSASNASDSTVSASEKVALVAGDAAKVSGGAETLAKKMEEISLHSKENAAGADETRKTASELADMAENMEKKLGRFKLN